MTIPTTKIFVISLRSAEDRRKAISEALEHHPDISWEYFDAHTSPQPMLQLRKTFGKREMTPAELGCYSSHFTLWEKLLEDECDQYLILEDDVVVDWSFIKKLLTIKFHNLGIDYLKLFCKVPAKWRYVATLFRYFHIVQLTSLGLGTQAYVLTKAAAKKATQEASIASVPIDAFLDSFWSTNIPCYAVMPAPLYEATVTSSIGEKRFIVAKLPPAEKLWNIMRRIKVKLICFVAGYSFKSYLQRKKVKQAIEALNLNR